MKVILAALHTAPADLPQQAASSSSSSSIGGKVNPAVAATAHSAVERVFDHCQQVLLTSFGQMHAVTTAGGSA